MFKIINKDGRIEVWQENIFAGYVDPETEILFGIGADGFAYEINKVERQSDIINMVKVWRIHPS